VPVSLLPGPRRQRQLRSDSIMLGFRSKNGLACLSLVIDSSHLPENMEASIGRASNPRPGREWEKVPRVQALKSKSPGKLKVATWDRTWVRQPLDNLGCSHPSGAAARKVPRVQAPIRKNPHLGKLTAEFGTLTTPDCCSFPQLRCLDLPILALRAFPNGASLLR